MSAQADLHALTALSPLDGRYAGKVAALASQFSEYGLIRNRVRVELAWLAALADEAALPEIAPISPSARHAIEAVASRVLRSGRAAGRSRRSNARPTTTSRRSNTG